MQRYNVGLCGSELLLKDGSTSGDKPLKNWRKQVRYITGIIISRNSRNETINVTICIILLFLLFKSN